MPEREDGRTTRDALFGGSLSIRQPARGAGYRVNVDALLLAAFAARALDGGASAAASSPGARAGARAPRRVRHAVDLGSGVGGVALSLLYLDAVARVTMIELDDGLAGLAAVNAVDNGWAERASVIRADVAAVNAASLPFGPGVDLVVCNPPYVPEGRGRPPRQSVRAARYGRLDVFVDAARRLAGRRVRVCFVYPAIEVTTLLATLRGRGLEPKRLRAVHGRAEDPARIVLVECAPAKAGGLVVEPPLVESVGRARSPAVAALLTTPRR